MGSPGRGGGGSPGRGAGSGAGRGGGPGRGNGSGLGGVGTGSIMGSSSPGACHMDQQTHSACRSGWRVLLRAVLAVFFVTAGTLHFLMPSPFEQIVPPYLPWPLALVYISDA